MERQRTKIVLRVPLEAQYLARLQRDFPEVDFTFALTPEEVAAELPDAHAVVGNAPLTGEQLARAANLRWVASTSAGVEKFPTNELAERDIVLTNFSGIGAPNIAEHVLGMMFAHARGLRLLIHYQDQHGWPDDESVLTTFELSGQLVGVVGMGEIGDELARRAHGIGMRVWGVQRHPEEPPPYVERLLPSDGLPELLAEADHVVLCLPLTAETKYTIDTDELARMKKGAYLFNVGRGELVNQEALIAAIRGGTVAGAGLDVTTPEPLPPDSPLWEMPNVLITGHTAARTPRYWERGIELLSENVRRFLAGEELKDTVDIKAGY